MATFIEEVALRLYEKYGDDISSLNIVLPSKRARLFLAEAISKTVSRPLWEPNYLSIDDLMSQLSELRKADRLRLISELHKIYSKYHNEDFDKFYHWGEMLIADFDMIDKYMVDASQLFSNIKDLKELESDMSYLSAEQIELINRFWRTLTGDNSGVIEESKAKSIFLKVWHSLGAIYQEYTSHLRTLGIGYTGMIYREAIEHLKQGKVSLSSEKRYVFVGFNALSKCEQALLQQMQLSGCAEFYWDYDNYYTDNKFQEAGLFIRDNIDLFPEEEGISHDNFKNIASVNITSTSSNVAQCQCVIDILEKIASQNKGVLDKSTTIVLTDENLLMPLLYALPEKFKVAHKENNGKIEEVPAINVTMGYPLRNTLAYSFVERLLELQKHAQNAKSGEVTFYYIDVEGLLTHPYINDSSHSQYAELRAEIVKHRLFQVPQSNIATTPLLQKIFRKVEGWSALTEYILEVIDAIFLFSEVKSSEGAFRADFLAIISDAITKLQNIVEQCDIEIPNKIQHSLIRRHLQAERVPFTGEPLEGLQIMGILETRNLDFKNVILLSMTDNNFPGNKATDKSFIPYSLRYGFNIPTAEHHEGVYAYYFYRLIERAENLYMLYSSAADDKSTGEPSRYIRQLEYETDFKINRSNVGVEVSLSDSSDIVVDKSDEIFDKLLRFTRDKALSPTAFSTYVKCPLKFYFNVVERLRPEDELEESVDNMTFGNIFHEAADLLYSQIKGDTAPDLRLAELRKRGEIDKCVDKAIAKVYFGDDDGILRHEFSGELLIIRNIVREYLGNNLLNYDICNNEFVVAETESDVKVTLPIEVGEDKFDIHLAGRADRIDSLNNGLLRVIDYKTGKPRLNYNGIDSLFHGEPIATKRESNIINTLLYSMMLSHERGRDVRPELYYVGSMVRKDYSPKFIETIERKSRTLESYSEVATEFENEVKSTLKEMFDRSIPFMQCEDSSACKYCDYQTICNKK